MGFDVLLGFLLNHGKKKEKQYFISFYSTFQGCVVLYLSIVYTENAMFGLHIKTKRNRTEQNRTKIIFLLSLSFGLGSKMKLFPKSSSAGYATDGGPDIPFNKITQSASTIKVVNKQMTSNRGAKLRRADF